MFGGDIYNIIYIYIHTGNSPIGGIPINRWEGLKTGYPTSHHGCFDTKSWSSMAWMIWVVPAWFRKPSIWWYNGWMMSIMIYWFTTWLSLGILVRQNGNPDQPTRIKRLYRIFERCLIALICFFRLTQKRELEHVGNLEIVRKTWSLPSCPGSIFVFFLGITVHH